MAILPRQLFSNSCGVFVGICGYWETLCPVYVHFFLTPTWYFYNSKPCFWILELVNVLSMHSGFIQNIHQFSYAKIFEGR